MSQTAFAGEISVLPVDHREWSSDEFCEEHRVLTERLAELREVGDKMTSLAPHEVGDRLERTCGLLANRIVPHVRSEYEHRAHLAARDGRPIPGREQEAEIERSADLLIAVWESVPSGTAGPPHSLRGLLFDLHSLLRLHFDAGC